MLQMTKMPSTSGSSSLSSWTAWPIRDKDNTILRRNQELITQWHKVTSHMTLLFRRTACLHRIHSHIALLFQYIHRYDKIHQTQVWQTSPYTGMTNFTICRYDKLHHTQVWQTSPNTGMTKFTKHRYDKIHHTQVWQTSPYTGMTNFTIHRYDELHQTAVNTLCLPSPVTVSHVPLDDLPATLLA